MPRIYAYFLSFFCLCAGLDFALFGTTHIGGTDDRNPRLAKSCGVQEERNSIAAMFLNVLVGLNNAHSTTWVVYRDGRKLPQSMCFLDPEMLNPARKRQPVQLTEEQKEQRVLLTKQWTRYRAAEHKKDLIITQGSRAQERFDHSTRADEQSQESSAQESVRSSL